MLKWLLATLLGAFIGISGYFIYYLGFLKPVTISEVSSGPFIFLYKEHQGAYHKIVSKIEEVEAWARKNQINCEKTFGEYFDDPRSIEEARLRARGGCILDHAPKNIPDEFKLSQIAEKKYVQALFAGSPAIGPFKVYPKIEDYFAAKKWKPGGSAIEIYTIHPDQSMTTEYLFSVPHE